MGSQKNKRIVKYKREDKGLPSFHRESKLNAGFDLFANLEKDIVINPGEVAFISLNVATEIPRDMVGLVFQRSSTYRKWGIKLTNGVGVIDSLYRGDSDIWGAEFKNETNDKVVIRHGDKICQAIFLELPDIVLKEVNKLGNGDRGGFGTSFDNVVDLEG